MAYSRSCCDGPIVQRPSTPPSHGGNAGPNPAGVTSSNSSGFPGELPGSRDAASGLEIGQ